VTSSGPERGRPALQAEQDLVKTLGGFVLALAGAELVTHERIPITRFNYVEVTGVGPGRQSAFFERTLDHYFQRALRPTFRVPVSAPAHVVAGLERFGFRRRPHPLTLLLGPPEPIAARPSGWEVRAATSAELDDAVSLWVEDRGRAEFRSAVEVAWRHPNPGERLTPMVAARDGRVVAAALWYEHRGLAGLHFVTTRPGERGQGAATALVTGAAGAGEPDAPRAPPFLWADSERLERGLVRLGFQPVLAFREYALPPEAELAFPSPGPATPPRWRPPRGR
jgi:hypothetical protein